MPGLTKGGAPKANCKALALINLVLSNLVIAAIKIRKKGNNGMFFPRLFHEVKKAYKKIEGENLKMGIREGFSFNSAA